MSSPLKPLRRDAAENRDRLLLVAAEVFADRGLDAGVADVARAAGMGVGTLYRRFPTKEALIDALIGQVLEAIIAIARDALTVPEGRGLEQFLRRSSAYQARYHGFLPRLWSTEEELVKTARGLIAELLADAKAHGQVREDLTPTDLTVIQWSVRGVLETTGRLAPEAWQRHLDLLVAGMRPGAEVLLHPPVPQAEIDAVLNQSGG